MFMPRKKDIFQELAVALYLSQRLTPGFAAASVLARLRERVEAALKAAEPFTGVFGEKDVQDFLTAKSFNFTVDCGDDIIKGDVIRFTEQVFNNKTKPPVQVGIRGIIAEVIGSVLVAGKPMLNMRVISSGGAWNIPADEQIRRTLRVITRMEVMRAPWEDETERDQAKRNAGQERPSIGIAKYQVLNRGSKDKTS